MLNYASNWNLTLNSLRFGHKRFGAIFDVPVLTPMRITQLCWHPIMSMDTTSHLYNSVKKRKLHEDIAAQLEALIALGAL